jgi:glycosyltransferase involved in cell wall biosynthesis
MSLRICYFGTYRAEYARNQILIEGLRRSGMQVVECHVALWQGVEDRVQTASGGWMRPAFWWRVLRTYGQLLGKYRQAGEYDILVVGYPGHFDVFLARLLASLRGKPLVWDVLNSLYLIATERGISARSPLTVRIIRWIERLACRLPDLLILDTERFVAWFREIHAIDPGRFRLVRIGADQRYFSPLEGKPRRPGDPLRVIYYGSYIPNHGVEFIVEAAHLLEDEPVDFEMVGDGPEHAKAWEIERKYRLKNLAFIDWLPRQELSEHIANADLVLGVFGTTMQNMLTNNNKIYEGFAMRKPVVSARTEALPESLVHGEHLYLCERGDPGSLAEAIRSLQADPELRQRLADNGYRLFCEQFDLDHIGQEFARHLTELAAG